MTATAEQKVMTKDSDALVARQIKNLRLIADASRREDGSDIPLGQEVRQAADTIERQAAEIDRLREERDRALYGQMRFDIMRYLIANTHGRLDGAEKAERHLKLSTCFCDMVFGADEYETDVMMAVHDGTQALTSYMDTEIGFPVFDRHPDIDTLAPLFFARFIELAHAALSTKETSHDR